MIDFGNLEGVKRLVQAALGVSIQPRTVVQREVGDGELAGLSVRGMNPRLK